VFLKKALALAAFPRTSFAMKREPTEFERRVYEFISRVPRGRVTTYAAVGRGVGCGSAQAIGQALRRNPFAPRVPCHRVVRSDLGLGGYSGKTGGAELRRKIELLVSEGVAIHDGCVDRASLWP
jgi:methylated-DNA-[protein]-cysteine S-methyltransferase